MLAGAPPLLPSGGANPRSDSGFPHAGHGTRPALTASPHFSKLPTIGITTATSMPGSGCCTRRRSSLPGPQPCAFPASH